MAFTERHKRAGLVTNQDPQQPMDRDEPHASTICCGRPECIAKATAYVAGVTNRQATYYPDGWQTRKGAHA